MQLTIKPEIKPVGLAAKKAAALALSGTPEPIKWINPNDAPERIGIVFDDSGSMRGSKIENAKARVEEFLRSCTPNQTAVSVYPMNASSLSLSSNLPALAMLVEKIQASDLTPLFEKLLELLKTNITRAIVFSDGAPNHDDFDYRDLVVLSSKEKSISVDTVFIGEKSDRGFFIMKALAEECGGIFLHFDPAKSNFRTAFKYLSPGLRLMLADKSFVEKLENGGV